MPLAMVTQKNNLPHLGLTATRIVSLVPSLTELLYALRLDDEVVGITKFCIHPEVWFRSKERIGGTKTVNIAIVKSLLPDLIIANKEENVKEQIEELQQFAPVYITDINNFEDALEAIMTIGNLVNRPLEATKLANEIKNAFTKITPLQTSIDTAYFIWKDPYMAAGGNTFINSMLGLCGLHNIFENISRYPEINLGEMLFSSARLPAINEKSSFNRQISTSLPTSTCQLILLSSEPYPFSKKHVEELQAHTHGTKILLVDGEMFSWYGSRMLLAADYFIKLIKEIQG